MHTETAVNRTDKPAGSTGADDPKVTSLAGFKRFLAEPGATVQKVRHDGMSERAKAPELWAPRRVEHLQSNAVRFEGGAWLYLEKGSHFRFMGDRVQHDPTGKFDQLLEYELSFTNPIGGERGGKAGTGGVDRRK